MFLTYLSICGTISAVCTLGRGMVSAAGAVLEGDLKKAGSHVIGAIVAPARMAYLGVCGVATDVACMADDVIETAHANDKRREVAAKEREAVKLNGRLATTV